jgi:OFA family oxalate/formate antiporter-like MFS transporter
MGVVMSVENHGWRVTLAGLGINLALGILYTWSVISRGVPDEWGWSQSDKSWPYAVACLVFCLVMVPAGRMQDRLGPRLVASIGGVLVGAGMTIASFSATPLGYVLGFGLLAGSGIGFGYASATPPAVKWFPAGKTGMIAGIVVSGFGLASVYAAPLSQWLIERFGLGAAVRALGVAFTIVVVALAQALAAPPKEWLSGGGPAPAGPGQGAGQAAGQGAAQGAIRLQADFLPGEMLFTWQFYALWFMYACGAGAGLMIISKLAQIASIQAGLALGFVLVAVLAVGNGAGRIVAGVISDRIGRKASFLIVFVFQAALILALSRATAGSALASPFWLALLSALIGANYGANLALFPSVTKDYYGLKNFGMNYGLIFTAWGVGGFMLALFAGRVYDASGSFEFAYYLSAALLLAAAAVTPILKPPQPASPESGG